MRRVIVLHYTGPKAENLVNAKRLARKIRGAVGIGQCVLVDCEGVEMTRPVLGLLAAEAHAEKVKFCGLSPADQSVLTQLINLRRGSTPL